MLKVGSRSDQISMEERDSWLEQLQIHLSQSQQEIDNLNNLKQNNENNIEYSNLLKKQETIVSEIENNLRQFNSFSIKTNQLLDSLNNITSDFNKANLCLEDGNYSPAIKLISKATFEKIISKVTEANNKV